MRSVLLWPADQPAADQAAAAAEAGAEAATAKVIPVLCVTCGVRVEVADDPDSILAYQNKHQGECPGRTPDGSDAA
jgi:alkanesulfonate monooxygenase SsuD/methylene tetrahydromethanopterin reductase-like flavin-dependent oxidoreductase (luciferase family)